LRELESLSSIQNLFSTPNKENQPFNLSSISQSLNNFILSNFKNINQHSEIISQFINIFYSNIEDFSITNISEAISILQKQLNSFRNSIVLLNNQQHDMGLIDSYNFLLSNCINSYQHFNNILSYFVKNPKY
jgi:hypothetical protein